MCSALVHAILTGEASAAQLAALEAAAREDAAQVRGRLFSLFTCAQVQSQSALALSAMRKE